ncbi:hypothetical protein ACA910_016566 [Epithemia clementina (nom. ined.)]
MLLRSTAGKQPKSRRWWWQRLVTTEDRPWHVHKTLGLLCLFSMVWRLPLVGRADLGFASHPQWTLPTIALHFSLNVSSFRFAIPPQRIKTGGYRIWPEYRWHSLIFLCRSLLYMIMVWINNNNNNNNNINDDNNVGESNHAVTGEQPQQFPYSLSFITLSSSRKVLQDWIFQHHVWNLALVLGTCAAADWASARQGPYRSHSIRGLHPMPALVKFFFSVAQILGTNNVLWGLPHRYTFSFLFCTIVQVNAFFMTLRRKNVASDAVLLFLYGAMLVGGITLTHLDQVYYANYPHEYLGMAMIAHTAALLRLGPRWGTRRRRRSGTHNREMSTIHHSTPDSTTATLGAILQTTTFVRGPQMLLTALQDNKYVLWTCMYLVAEWVARPLVQCVDDDHRGQEPTTGRMPSGKQDWIPLVALYAYYMASILAVVAVGVYKQYYDRSDEEEEKDYQEPKPPQGATENTKTCTRNNDKKIT